MSEASINAVYIEPSEAIHLAPKLHLMMPLARPSCLHSRASLVNIGPDLVTVSCDDCNQVWRECGVVNPALLRKAGP